MSKMLRSLSRWVPAVALAATMAACTTPPINTPTVTTTVTLQELGYTGPSGNVPLVPPLPQFNAPPQAVNTSQAQSVTVSTAVLHMKLTNNMQLPLNLSFYLAPTSSGVYSTTPIATASLAAAGQPGSTVNDLQANIDPTLLKSNPLYVGVGVGTPGSNTPVTVQPSDNVQAVSYLTVQVKLF